MDKETIERAARSWAEGEITKSRTERAERAFKQGARWRVEAVWHDPREESPSGFRPLLMQDTSGEIDLGYMLPRGIMRWAYVSDLIPDDGKEDGR